LEEGSLNAKEETVGGRWKEGGYAGEKNPRKSWQAQEARKGSMTAIVPVETEREALSVSSLIAAPDLHPYNTTRRRVESTITER